jgi:hypothetical protein
MMSLHWRSAGYLFARTMVLAEGRFYTLQGDRGK